MIASAFDPRTRRWARPFPEALSRHDVVYQSPPEDALQGLPIGNGDLGMLLWTEGSRLVAAVNKVDLFDDSPDSGDGMVAGVEYDHEPSLRHGARLIVDFGMPVFDVLYLQQFEGRLGLADATAAIRAETPFMKAKLSAFASNPDRVIAIECEAECGEECAVDAVLERFGSRPYPYWYSGFNRDATIGLDGTQTSVEGNTVLIRQRLRALEFVVAARICGAGASATPMHSRAGRLCSGRGERVRFTVLITAVTSENAADPHAEALAILDGAEAKGVGAIRAAHAADWEAFWRASFVSIPNDYVENIWYLNLYHANSSCRGAHPPRFNNGIWGWNRDVSNWVYYFHWNMQNFIWPLHTANHGELARPYFDFRVNSLPNAMIYAKNQQKQAGAFFADVADRHGRNVGTRWYNQTPGSQIALLFWKHYKYTGDRRFLEEKGWPVLRETARYYASLAVRGGDGVWRTLKSQAYEGSPLFEEVITDTAMIRALMPAAADCAELLGQGGPEADAWRELGGHMNAFHRQEMDDDELETDGDGRRRIKYGVGRGKEVLSGRAFTVGIYRMLEGEDDEGFDYDALPDYIKKPLEGIKNGDRIRDRHGNPARPSYYGIPDPEFAPVFPAELIGLKDKGSDLFNTSVDQVRLHPPAKPPEATGEGSMAGGGALCMGWCPYPIVLARLGLADEAAEAAEHSVMAWQFYCQGFGHYGPYEVFSKDKDLRWHTNTVTEHKTRERFLSPAWPFRHFTLEAMPIVCTTVNEMLLQSHEGLIRLLPATPSDWSGGFQLAAEGGFLVHADYERGAARWAAVESRRGGCCRLAHPWQGAPAWLTAIDSEGAASAPVEVPPQAWGQDNVLEFDTAAGMLYLLAREPGALDDWEVRAPSYEPNRAMKSLGKVSLGLPRMF